MKITYAPQAVSGVTSLMYVGDNNDLVEQATNKIFTMMMVGGFALGVLWLLKRKLR